MGRKPAPQPLMLAGPNASGHDDDPLTAATAETPHSGLSLANSNSKSPRSPRSPPLSARLTPKRSPDLIQHHARRPSLPNRDLHDPDAQHQAYPSITTALEPPSGPSIDTTTSANTATVSTTAQAPHPPSETGKKPTKGGFFHFSKASKSSNHLNEPPQQQQEPEPISSNDGDDLSTTKKGGKTEFFEAPPHHQNPRLRVLRSSLPAPAFFRFFDLETFT